MGDKSVVTSVQRSVHVEGGTTTDLLLTGAPFQCISTMQRAIRAAMPVWSQLCLIVFLAVMAVRIIGWISLPKSLFWNARYKSKLIPQPPSNLSELKAQIYQYSNLQRLTFYEKRIPLCVFNTPILFACLLLTFLVRERRTGPILVFCNMYLIFRLFYLKHYSYYIVEHRYLEDRSKI